MRPYWNAARPLRDRSSPACPARRWESSAVFKFGSDFVDSLRRGLEPGVVFGVQEAAYAPPPRPVGREASAPVQACAHHHGRDGREEDHGCHDRHQGTAGGNERRLRDPGRAQDGRTDPAADGHRRRGIDCRQENVAGHQGRCSGAPGAKSVNLGSGRLGSRTGKRMLLRTVALMEWP